MATLRSGTIFTNEARHTSGQGSGISQVPYSLKKFHGAFQPVSFSYPDSWTLSIVNENFPSGQDEGGYVGPNGLYFADGRHMVIDPTSNEPSREFTIVTSDKVTVPFWSYPLYYVEAIIAAANGTYEVVYGLGSSNPQYDHVQSFFSTQDALPIIIATPTQQKTSANIGIVYFSGGTWGIATKNLAYSYFQTPEYLANKEVILSLSFSKFKIKQLPLNQTTQV